MVNATSDGGDANPGDNVCDDGAGSCTLRAAIDESNAHPGKDTISFKITSSPAPWVIAPAAELTHITDAVTLDGVTGTGASCTSMSLMVTVDGSGTSAVNGLTLSGAAGTSTVKGLVITNFDQSGLLLLQVSSVVMQCNIIGLQQDGSTPAGNNHGVEINGMSGVADLNAIGGSTSTRNVISGNINNGIYIHDIVDGAAKGNKILSNLIGTDVSGTVTAGNATGIAVSTAPKTIIGGKGTALGNVIAANLGDGIALTSAPGTLIQSNKVGTDSTGQIDLGNDGSGVSAFDSDDLLIGGASKSFANVISGNTSSGVSLSGGSDNALVQGNYIGVNLSGSLQIPNGGSGVLVSSSDNVTIGGNGSTLRNIISGNTLAGVNVLGTSTGVKIQGNYIGVDKTGYFSVPNLSNGVNMVSVSGNTIGGNASGLRNVISGNGVYGVSISSSTTGNIVQGNYIGVNALANAALPNGSQGVSLAGCTGCLIGGMGSSGERNIISGNTGAGIGISGGAQNLIYGNYIGTDAAGKLALPNSDGITSNTSADNRIGSSASTLARNLISANNGDGIAISIDDSDLIEGNYIGTDVTGKVMLGNAGYGVRIFNSTNVVLGGAAANARNIISGSRFYGVLISGNLGSNNEIYNNYIGTDVTGKVAIANGQHPTAAYGGIYIDQSPNTLIGGPVAGQGNVIAGNDGNGIEVFLAAGTLIRGNFIGLDSSGATALPNTDFGIALAAPTGTVIGGSGAGEGNVISGNLTGGIDVTTGNNNTISGNKIGTNASGTLAVPNLYSGISLNSASGVTIGGTTAAHGNLISGNTGNGISVDAASSTLTARFNVIGTDITRMVPLGNGFMGISSGSALSSADNVVAFNGTGGIYQDGAFGAASTGNCLFFNLVPAGYTFKHSSAITAIFEDNWWGDAAGPLLNAHDYTNPARQDAMTVNNGLIDFTPFLTTPPSGCPVGQQLLLGNTGMETDSTPADGIPDSWTGSSVDVTLGEGRRTDDVHAGTYSFKMTAGGKTSITQTNTISGSANDSLVLSFHTRGIGVSGKGLYQATVKIGKKTFTYNIPLNSSGSTGGWVIRTLPIRATENFTTVTVTLTFTMPYGSAWFDDVSLMKVTVTP